MEKLSLKEKLKSVIDKRPVLSCLVMLIIVYLFYAFPGMMTRVFPFLKEHYFYRFISVIFSHYVVVLIVIMLLDYGWIYRKGNFLKTLLVGMALIVEASLSCYFSIVGAFRSAADSSFLSFPYILLGIITIIGIGFFEESFFRGVISNIIGKHYAKDRKGVWLSVFISSVFFGLLHMVSQTASGNHSKRRRGLCGYGSLCHLLSRWKHMGNDVYPFSDRLWTTLWHKLPG